tara:strand:- start:29830 stop:30690 length:861 start_codon:yes stop_codon:yes gene_type:complete
LKDYLVILAGSPRGGESTWNSLYKYVISHLDADLAICCSDRWNQDISLFKNAQYKWIFPEFDNYIDYYIDNFSESSVQYLESGLETGLYTSGSVHFVFKDIILNNYLDILKKYKYIIYTRFDQKYTYYHPAGVEGQIFIPEGEDYYGICDRHAMFPSSFSKNFLGICKYINTQKALAYAEEFNNCETTFKNHLTSAGLIKNVKRYKRSQFTASLKGEHTNWRVAEYKLYFFKNLMIKYPDEFLYSISNLIKKEGVTYAMLNELRLFLNYFYLTSRIKLGTLKRKYE